MPSEVRRSARGREGIDDTSAGSSATADGGQAGDATAAMGSTTDAGADRRRADAAVVRIAVAGAKVSSDGGASVPAPDAGTHRPMPDAGDHGHRREPDAGTTAHEPDAGTTPREPDAGNSQPDAGDRTPVPEDETGLVDEDAGAPAGLCPIAVAATPREPPTVWLIVDASGSMVNPLGGTSTSRWDAVRQALLGVDGTIYALQSQVQWGMILFTGPSRGGSSAPPGPTNDDGAPGSPGSLEAPDGCLRTATVEPRVDNYDTLFSAFPRGPLGGSTPTDRVLQLLLARYPSEPASATSILLVTDGAPNDLCGSGNPDVGPRVIEAVRSLRARSITTYALSLAGDDAELLAHLSALNAAGGTGKPLFTPADASELTAGLREMLGDAGCHIRLAQPIELARACEGVVTLDGSPLTCEGADGYRLHDALTLGLSGQACESYRAQPSSQLDVAYPCESLAAPDGE